MLLSQKALKEFREIWKKQFREDITDETANEKGVKLLKFFQLIHYPIPKEDKQNARLADRKIKK